MTRLASLVVMLFCLQGCGLLSTARPTSASGFTGWPVLAEENPRYGHATTLLSDGRVLVTGGEPETSRADIYDPSDDSWTTVAEMPAHYVGHRAVLLADGRVFVYGGAYHGLAQSHAAVYDPATDSWIGGVIQEYVDGRDRHTVDVLPDGRVLIAGGDHMGWSSLNDTNRARTYDPSFSASYVSYEAYLQQPILWQCLARSSHASAAMPDGSIMLTGGWFAGVPLDETERFDPVANEFVPMEPMNLERSGHTATTLADGRILVAGGVGRRPIEAPQLGRCVEPVEEPGGIVITFPVPRLPVPPHVERIPAPPRHLENVEIYDPQTGVWSAAPSMRHPRAQHQATLLSDGRVLVTGGVNEDGANPFAEIFDPRTLTWEELPPMGHNRSRHTATAMPDGRVLVIGGVYESVTVAPVELWAPR